MRLCVAFDVNAKNLLSLLMLTMVVSVGCVSQTPVPQPISTESLAATEEWTQKHYQAISNLFNGFGVFHTEARDPRTDFEIPRNREQINAGNYSRFPNLRDPSPRLYVFYPDIPNQSTSDSYLEILKSGKRVDASITVAEGYGFVVIEPADELELSVIYCLPAELSEMGETDKRCFSSIGFLEVGESPWPGH